MHLVSVGENQLIITMAQRKTMLTPLLAKNAFMRNYDGIFFSA